MKNDFLKEESLEEEYIPLSECKDRHLYKIVSRNLTLGVFNAERKGFIGIREKFGGCYLFMEFHWDTGAPYGTVSPLKELEKIPDNIQVSEDLGTADSKSSRKLIWDDNKYGWFFEDDGKKFISQRDSYPVSITNEVLFNYLKVKEDENK